MSSVIQNDVLPNNPKSSYLIEIAFFNGKNYTLLSNISTTICPLFNTVSENLSFSLILIQQDVLLLYIQS